MSGNGIELTAKQRDGIASRREEWQSKGTARICGATVVRRSEESSDGVARRSVYMVSNATALKREDANGYGVD